LLYLEVKIVIKKTTAEKEFIELNRTFKSITKAK